MTNKSESAFSRGLNWTDNFAAHYMPVDGSPRAFAQTAIEALSLTTYALVAMNSGLTRSAFAATLAGGASILAFSYNEYERKYENRVPRAYKLRLARKRILPYGMACWIIASQIAPTIDGAINGPPPPERVGRNMEWRNRPLPPDDPK